MMSISTPNYSSDIFKSNVRQISKPNISKTAMIFEEWYEWKFLRFLSSVKICLFEKYAMKIVEGTIGHC